MPARQNGTSFNGDKTDIMEKLIVKNGQDFGIDGWHKLSVCDVRAARAGELQREIVQFTDSGQRTLDRLFSQIHTLKAKRYDVKDSFFGGLGLRERLIAEIEAEIAYIRASIQSVKEKKHYTLQQMYADLRQISAVQVLDIHNIIPTAGRAVIAKWLIGDNTYDADIGANYGSLGTGTTAPANGDTQLATETYRKARSSEAQSNNVAVLSMFYTATEVNGTFEEAGWHIAGSGSANSGQLLSRFLTGSIVKSVTETLTVESTLTIT